MVRVFVNSVSTSVAKPLVAALAAEGHEIVGSTISPALLAEGMEGVVELVACEDKDKVAELVATADVTVLSLHEGGFRDKSAILRSFNSDELTGSKRLICVSSVMTWAKTPKGNPEAVFNEADYMGRKPASKYTSFRTVETEVLSTKKPGVAPCVVAAGLLYGGTGGNFACLMRDAWMMETEELAVPSLKDGSNTIPSIHVADLAGVVCKLIASEDPALVQRPYMVAVDKAQVTLTSVADAIARELGTGATRATTRDEAEEMMLDEPDLTDLQVDLRFNTEGDSGMALLQAQAGMSYTDGPVSHIKAVAAQFVKARDLRPLRMVVCGPPGSGVKACCDTLAKKYVLSVVDEEAAIAVATATEEEEGKEAELKQEVEAAVAGGGLPSALKARLLRRLLTSKRCRNQGYILQHTPVSFNDALQTFLVSWEEERPVAAADDPETWRVNEKLRPTHMVLFSGDDDEAMKAAFMADWEQAQRAKLQAEAAEDEVVEVDVDVSAGEADFGRRLQAYRDANKEEDEQVPARFFEQVCGLETLVVAQSDGADAAMEAVTNYVEGGGGKPYNFHPTKEEQAFEDRRARTQAAKDEAAAAEAAEAQAKRAAEEQAQKQAAIAARESEIRRQETEMLQARSLPLREYLMANVIPSLTEGMLEVVKVQPEDPVDYLAEYLFKKNVKSEEELEALAKDQGM